MDAQKLSELVAKVRQDAHNDRRINMGSELQCSALELCAEVERMIQPSDKLYDHAYVRAVFPEANYIASDRNVMIWAYTHKPTRSTCIWVAEKGDPRRIDTVALLRHGVDWKDSIEVIA